MQNIPVFLSSDNNYAPFVAVTIASICDNTKKIIDFFILDSGIKKVNKEKILNLKNRFKNFKINYVDIDTDKNFIPKKYTNNSYITLATYSRLLIPLLKPDLKKVLYVDADTLILNDISDLYNIELENYALGAAWNPKRVLYNTDTKEPLELSDSHKYFNAGVLLIDIQKWIKDDVVNSLFEIQKKYDGKILHADETLLNKYFDSNYQIFGVEWNYTDYDILNNPDITPKIRHFASAIKPWNSNFCILGKDIVHLKNFADFWHYAQMTDFYEEIKKGYEMAINKSPFTKRMSIIADRMI